MRAPKISASVADEAAVGHVVAHGVVKQDGLLGDHADLAPERGQGDVPDIVAVDADGAVGGVVEPGQKVQEGGFAGPGGTHQGHHFAPAHGEVDVVEDVFPAVVGEADPGIADLLGQGRQGRGPGGVLNLRLPVHEAEDPHRRGQTFLEDVLDRAQALDGLVEHEEGGQKGEEGAGGGGAPNDGITAVKNNAGHPQGAQKLHHRRGQFPGGVQLHADAEIVPVGLGRSAVLRKSSRAKALTMRWPMRDSWRTV